ncbi:MAG TPA: DUF167 domain-containing protein [Bacteroidota bacterium]|nr:DUF167 domain-containing protein [Bacteroidota bacterium]
MKIKVFIKPNAKKNEVLLQSNGTYIVRVAAPAVDGKANAKLIEVLAEHFGKPKSSVVLTVGTRGRNKILEIL